MKKRTYRQQVTLHNSDIVWVLLRDGMPDRVYPTSAAAHAAMLVHKELYPECTFDRVAANFWVH